MTTQTISLGAIKLETRLATGLVCLMLGFGMLAGIGFAGAASVHNAAHDTRHATGFPCH